MNGIFRDDLLDVWSQVRISHNYDGFNKGYFWAEVNAF